MSFDISSVVSGSLADTIMEHREVRVSESPFAVDGRCFIVAEIAQSHDGSVGMAHAFVDAAANAGADAVKFQTHIAAEESTVDEPWRVRFSPQDDTRYEYWQRMEFTQEQWAGLRAHAHEREIKFASSPFSIAAVRLLDEIEVDVFKIASGELTTLPMLEAIAETKRPIIVSSGMSPLDEVGQAIDILKAHGSPISVLQCTSEYPCPPERVGLNIIGEFRQRFGIPVGLSDHSGTMFPALAAATLGIDVLEVHLTMSKAMFGPDVAASITTEEFSTMVDGVRFIESAVANPVDKQAAASGFSTMRTIFMKSVVAAADLSDGTVITMDDLAFKKPGTGIPAAQYRDVIGRRLRNALQADQQITSDDLEAM